MRPRSHSSVAEEDTQFFADIWKDNGQVKIVVIRKNIIFRDGFVEQQLREKGKKTKDQKRKPYERKK